MIRWLRNNHLVIITTLGFLLSVALLLFMIDGLSYQARKNRIITDNFLNQQAGKYRDTLKQSIDAYLLESNPEQKQAQKKILEDKILSIVADDDNIFFKIKITDGGDREVITRGEDHLARMREDYVPKTQRFNNFSNCLFYLGFAESAYINLEAPGGSPGGFVQPRSREEYEVYARIQWFYTTPPPPHDHEIRELTAAYRWISSAVVLSFGGFYFYLLWFLILPVKKVMTRIDEIRVTLPRILPRPRSLIEKRYNDLASNAMLVAINHHTGDLLSKKSAQSKIDIYRGLPEIIANNLMLNQAAVFEIYLNQDRSIRRIRPIQPEDADERLTSRFQLDADRLRLRLEKYLSDKNGTTSASFRLYSADKELRRNLSIGTINETADGLVLDLFVGLSPMDISREMQEWQLRNLERAAGQIRSGIERLELQKQMIVSQKRQANISLSRNLGHDLTNIIATSKLDLMTLKRFLNAGDRSPLDTSRGQQIFSETLQHLINNTEYMQEIVNIYRSFAYTRNPKYERVSIKPVLEQICEIFRLSTSRNLTLDLEIDEQGPQVELEVRLIKLAIFNLLSNAMEAVYRHRENQDKAHIQLTAHYQNDSTELAIKIKDNGPGIRDHDGRLLGPDEIDPIFELGMTTKSEIENGEGLGLNWVKAIVTDFHNGKLSARNRPEGGAEFTLTIPLDNKVENAADQPRTSTESNM